MLANSIEETPAHFADQRLCDSLPGVHSLPAIRQPNHPVHPQIQFSHLVNSFLCCNSNLIYCYNSFISSHPKIRMHGKNLHANYRTDFYFEANLNFCKQKKNEKKLSVSKSANKCEIFEVSVNSLSSFFLCDISVLDFLGLVRERMPKTASLSPQFCVYLRVCALWPMVYGFLLLAIQMESGFRVIVSIDPRPPSKPSTIYICRCTIPPSLSAYIYNYLFGLTGIRSITPLCQFQLL